MRKNVTLSRRLPGILPGFLIELGAGFAFVGRQYRLEVGGDEFLIDLLFYHLKLRCYVVVELKPPHSVRSMRASSTSTFLRSMRR